MCQKLQATGVTVWLSLIVDVCMRSARLVSTRACTATHPPPHTHTQHPPTPTHPHTHNNRRSAPPSPLMGQSTTQPSLPCRRSPGSSWRTQTWQVRVAVPAFVCGCAGPEKLMLLRSCAFPLTNRPHCLPSPPPPIKQQINSMKPRAHAHQPARPQVEGAEGGDAGQDQGHQPGGLLLLC